MNALEARLFPLAGMTIIAAPAAIVASVALWDVARRSNPTSFPPSL
jgi:hypothetical protein